MEIMKNNEIFIRLAQDSGGEFSEQILADLVAQGYIGEELLQCFSAASRKIRPAVEKILEEARQVAEGKAPYAKFEDVFSSEDG